MSGMFSGLSDLDFSGFGQVGEEPEPETVPVPGSAHLVVEDKCEALFVTADWTIVAKVGEHELGRSSTIKQAHTRPFIKRWVRHLIRQNKARLRRLGVDVPATYTQWGGVLADLDD